MVAQAAPAAAPKPVQAVVVPAVAPTTTWAAPPAACSPPHQKLGFATVGEQQYASSFNFQKTYSIPTK